MDKYKVMCIGILGGTVIGYLCIVNKAINIMNGTPTKKELEKLKLIHEISENLKDIKES